MGAPQALQRLETWRQQVPEAEAAAVERQMEEARENIRKAEVGPLGRGLGVASGSVTPRVGDTWTGRGGAGNEAPGIQLWGCGAEDALPLWGPGVTRLAGLSPDPAGVPLAPDNTCVSPGQPGEG